MKGEREPGSPAATMIAREPDIEAIVSLLPTASGGRSGPAFSGYRPAHLVMDGLLTSGVHEYHGVDRVLPGESVRATITFLAPEEYPGCLWEGRVLSVQEGGRVVGQATVIRILNPVLRRAE